MLAKLLSLRRMNLSRDLLFYQNRRFASALIEMVYIINLLNYGRDFTSTTVYDINNFLHIDVLTVLDNFLRFYQLLYLYCPSFT